MMIIGQRISGNMTWNKRDNVTTPRIVREVKKVKVVRLIMCLIKSWMKLILDKWSSVTKVFDYTYGKTSIVCEVSDCKWFNRDLIYCFVLYICLLVTEVY